MLFFIGIASAIFLLGVGMFLDEVQWTPSDVDSTGPMVMLVGALLLIGLLAFEAYA